MKTLLMVLTVLAGLYLFVRLVANSRKRHREQMDDEVDHDEWKKGSPDDPVPDNAVPVKQTGIKDESN